MKNKRGITLVSLVITIIILIILAGVTINLTIGENGLFRKAQFAKDKYLNAQSSEEEQLNELYAYLAREDLPENTKENPQPVGTPVKLPSSWQTVTPYYVSVPDGGVVKESTKVASVYAVSVGNGNTVPVPVGFWYVGGTLDTGVVISDKEADSYKKNGRDMTGHSDAINLIGNQFVFIPCTATEYVKSNWASGNQGNQTAASNAYWGTTTTKGETEYISKYGGFYVSRYEAGLPEGTTEFTGSLIYTSNYYNSIEGIPQSKAGVLPWNFIDWNNSKIKAEKMYETKNNIASGLITGTQWDVMIKKLESKGYSTSNSKAWGNYSTGEAFNYTGRAAEFKTSDNKLYAFGELKENATKANNTGYLLSTGASEHNKAYNLYDVAGNLWEWTEESAAHYSSSIGSLITNRMTRGGSFRSDSSGSPARYRYGSYDSETTYYGAGFRVVLYMK